MENKAIYTCFLILSLLTSTGITFITSAKADAKSPTKAPSVNPMGISNILNKFILIPVKYSNVIDTVEEISILS